MSKIIKKVVMGTDGMHFACGPCGGQDLIEMIIDHDGKEIYISATNSGEDTLYFVSNHSVWNYMEELDTDIYNEVIESQECGSINDYENEDEVAKSEYYDCFKYLNMVFNDSFSEGEEYTSDYGQDIEKMANLGSLSGYDSYLGEGFDSELSDENEAYKKRLFLEANIITETVYDSVDAGIKKAMIKDLTKLDKSINLDEYKLWKEQFLETEYEKVKDTKWVTVDYLFAGIGNFSSTFAEEELPEFENWISSMGSAFMKSPKKAKKEDILLAIALHIFD